MTSANAIAYCKRFKMEVGLQNLPAAALPSGFRALPWSPDLLAVHAEVLFASFRDEIDASVFASLGDREGCLLLLTEITRRKAFIPEATWLLVGPKGPCGTIQALRERGGLALIQNLGVVPAWRCRGLGRSLLLLALEGCRQAGHGRAQLEVTARNDAAMRLYRDLGFRRCKTLYKAVAAPPFPGISGV
jgi:ribosomal protein S18 acetylase RimI-like enzyme